ncbi:hypothetical protein ACXM5X_27575 [Pseudomonas saponiphila]|nr:MULTISPECIES: hypothetical protein [Pseudomonas]
MAEVLTFAAEGNVKVDIERQPLPAINKVLNVASNVVIDFGLS